LGGFIRRPRGVTLLQVAIEHGGGLVARLRCQVAGTSDRVTAGGRLTALVIGVTALMGAAVTNIARGVMYPGVTPFGEIPIAGRLIVVGGRLIAVGRTLVHVGGRLIAVGTRLVAIRKGLIAFRQGSTSLQIVGNRGVCRMLPVGIAAL
jgi:hypothetical protein